MPAKLSHCVFAVTPFETRGWLDRIARLYFFDSHRCTGIIRHWEHAYSHGLAIYLLDLFTVSKFGARGTEKAYGLDHTWRIYFSWLTERTSNLGMNMQIQRRIALVGIVFLGSWFGLTEIEATN